MNPNKWMLNREATEAEHQETGARLMRGHTGTIEVRINLKLEVERAQVEFQKGQEVYERLQAKATEAGSETERSKLADAAATERSRYENGFTQAVVEIPRWLLQAMLESKG